MNRKCKQCKNSFPIKRINQYYCSQSCRQKAYLLRNGFSQEKKEDSDVNPDNLLKNITNSLNPELLQELLSMVSDNPSLTDLLRPNTEKAGEIREKQRNDTTKSVNDKKQPDKGFMKDYYHKRKEPDTLMREKSGDLGEKSAIMAHKTQSMEASCCDNADSMGVSCAKHGDSMQVAWDDHASSMEKAWKNSPNSMSKGLYKGPGYTSNDTCSMMLNQQMTIPIGKNGYVKSLFPNWTDKEWKYSLCINRELVEVLNVLYNASQKNRIETKALTKCQKTLKSVSIGFQSIFLPKDYPFMRFIRYLKSRVTETLDKISDQKDIKFKLSEELKEQILILRFQLSE